MRVIMIALALSLSLAACHQKVIAFDTKEERAVVRIEQDKDIDLVVLALAGNKKLESIAISSSDDPEKERTALRAKRWKAAEADLERRGFTFINAEASVSWDLASGVTLGLSEWVERVAETGEEGSWLVYRHSLVAQKGDREVDVDGFDVAGFWVSPKERFVLVAEPPERCVSIRAVELATVAEKLKGKDARPIE